MAQCVLTIGHWLFFDENVRQFPPKFKLHKKRYALVFGLVAIIAIVIPSTYQKCMFFQFENELQRKWCSAKKLFKKVNKL